MPPPPRRPPAGIQWPLVPNSKKEGDRSTTYANKAALKTASGAIRPEEAAAIDAERNWRKNYGKYLLRHVSACLEVKDGAVTAAEAGLQWVHDNFEFIKDGKTMPLSTAMATIKSTFKTATVTGSVPRPETPPPLRIPYKGKVLEGGELERQVVRWVEYGTIEPSAGDAILTVMRTDEWRDLSDKYFVLLGASSAMGPLRLLLELGANVIAVDLDRPHIWTSLLALARASSGTMTFPTKGDTAGMSDEQIAGVAGCNLLTETPEILDWLRSTHAGKPLVVGAYAYLDGELHVRVSLAMDAIIKGLTEDKAAHPAVTPAYLCTPTDIHVSTADARAAAAKNYSPLSSPFAALLRLTPLFWFGPLRPNFGGRLTVKGPEETYYVVDGLVNRQGPNYALAKRMQHWRAVVARARGGCAVSSNIAPSTATASVTHNRLFAMAYGGMHWFKPMEVFQQETSNAVMGALLLRDVSDRRAKGASPAVPLSTPLQIFSFGAFHGGVWRLGFKMDTIGEASILMYLLVKLLKLLFVVAVVGAGTAGLIAASKHTAAEL
eukprot:TRINITY_DN3221_c0_g1_i3.p1 TRINITY_DN3221_c0_g1~~TRINITY_DN3221_c0_g1_i3.p1  ORF type:complete len:570 (-),score=234.90 TRINITY_DN3221_c0_g1_i3:293-1939(-)